MRGIVELWLSQLYKLTVLWPAWLLTPEGLKALVSSRTLWRVALTLAFVLAVAAFIQAYPPGVAFIGAGDVVAYLDIIAIAWVAGAAKIVRAGVELARQALKRRPAALVAARRESRAAMRRRRQRRPPPPANDDARPGGRWTVAA
ncbi:hypothetical protein [Phenylobacterium sp.]|uniref:hypothetical protein n=1 Tax=Phenylobacterium sp. TaxID=1871053 RepID=UPI002B7C0786|nr:hypothetical protein [Phenylobacterium sp.]HLZ75101.1 hypothetical protein [Phenylobacterium sp.]